MESHSPADESETSEPVVLDATGKRLYTVAMLTIYREAALANYAEAEDLMHRALELREAGHALLERASQLTFQYAMETDMDDAVAEDDIAW